MKKYKIGQVIKCKVTGIEKYGIFVNVDKNFNGLIHISEVSNEFVRNVEDYVYINELIFAKITNINIENYQMNLSIKDIDYENTGKKRENIEAENEFGILKAKLPIWIDEKVKEYNIEKTSI